ALDFLANRLPKLAHPWTVLGRDTLLKYQLSPPLEARVGQEGLTLEFTSGDQRLAGVDAVASWLAGIRYIRLDDGTMARLPEAWMQRHAKTAHEVLDVGGRAPHLTFLRLQLLGENTEVPLLERPAGLRAKLRPYQRQGWSWLAHRRELGVGCVLADDMGLGKTLQTIAVLLDTHRHHNDRRPSLLVVPTSVLGNWCEEIERFAPELHRKLVVYYGPDRHLPKGEALVLTTPGVLRADNEVLQPITWRYLVLDEAQLVKNPRSQLATLLRTFKATHRLALTGTPLENHVDELWSLLATIEPGLLGSREVFHQRYGASPNALHQRVTPFILRRLKDEVASDLPPRQTMVLRCSLTDRERQVYDVVRTGAARVLKKLPDGIEAGAVVLRALLRLRQACCHPSLLKDIPVDLPDTSSKLELLVERLGRAIESGHRCLVFSQWTAMLDIVESRLKLEGWPHLRLDGKCTANERTERVRVWLRPDGPPIFLLTLRAGGVGLNLTSADCVIFLDPWWNPAAEAQARDRAHRIGQTRPVMVYKIIAADTVEDRILGMQARKRQLFRTVVDGLAPEQLDLSQLTGEQLSHLLADRVM
ncbi:MAG: DEAD/DEAH box helicase, partial [Proteobacteria bacterium]|nr:DEAD/DEAH box helicase [Pseudomonadota bacterium]